ncbi:hypothetical protein V5799_019782 [Amblyomma americanum]|uniref:Na+/dicarboxylate na+/tricarboxylate and phosphate transporter n=1 Tax=Amblyomma americanum TaxID=6943 RepID=A0AAQ4EVX6_AMBAM
MHRDQDHIVHDFLVDKESRFFGALTLAAYLAPVYLTPLLAPGTMEGRCAYCVLLMFEFWALNVIPAPMASLVPFVLLPLLGIMAPDLVAQHYLNDTMLFIIGVVFLALAVEGTNMYSRVALGILGLGGAGVKAVFTGLVALAFCGALIFENVLSTLIVMPIVECTIVEIENDAMTNARRRRMLRRASVMARILGQVDNEPDVVVAPAMVTSPKPTTGSAQHSRRGSRGSRDTIATPESGISIDHSRGAFGNRRKSSAVSLDFAVKFEQETQKYLLIRRVLLLSVAYSATLGAIGSVFGNPASRILRMVLEERYSYDRLFTLPWLVMCLPIAAAGMVACWVAVFAIFLKDYDCEEDEETKESIAKILEEKYVSLGGFSNLEFFVMGCLLTLFGVLLVRSRITTTLAQPGEFGLVSHRDTTALFVLVLLFFVTPQRPCERPFNEYLLDWHLLHRKVPWSAFITYGGGLCIAGAVKESGLMAWLSSVLLLMRHWPPAFVQVVLMLITTLLTEVNNDTAAATVLIPIACDLAESSRVNPLYYGLPVTVACSTGLLLPVASLPMALVHANLLDHRLARMVREGFDPDHCSYDQRLPDFNASQPD